MLWHSIEDRYRPAHVFDVSLPGLDRRQWIEMDGIGVVPAEIFLVDRLHIVPDMAVVATPVPRAVEAFRQTNCLADFGCRQSVIHQATGLVGRELLEVTLLADHVVHAVAAPA